MGHDRLLRPRLFFWILIGSCFLSATAQAQNQTIQDNFTGASAAQNWQVFDGACLTAGSGTGSIPACYGNSYYGTNTLVGGQTGLLPDTVGNGALRFTNNYYFQTGAIVSNFTFPSGSGLSVTFSTVTYGGTGADGIGFFLMDGALKPGAVGGSGGSLGYSCSNTNGKTDGLVGAYMGLGIDEYGNFLNATDNTSSGNGFVPGRIGLRGSGNTSWAWLNANYPTWYPSRFSTGDRLKAMQKTCSSGYLWDFSGSVDYPTQKSQITYNYNMVPGGYVVLPSTTPLYTNATTRPAATPITYQLKITQDSLLSLSYSYNGGIYQPVLTNQSIANSNGPMPSTFRFGFSGSTGGSTNIHEVTCFQAAPVQQSSSSAGINTQQTGQVKTGTQIYLGYFHTNNWWGQMTSQNLLYDSSKDTVTIASVANWDASCVLTGGACTATGGSNTAQGPSSRKILTWGDGAGIPLQWSNLSANQRATLTQGDSTANANRLNFLRGDRSNEISTGGSGWFRQRTGVLGDIQDSAPTWVGPPTAPYADAWADKINAAATVPENATVAQRYSAFKTAAATRQNVVYVGANDGLMHGFRAGGYNSSGNFVDNTITPNDGKEALAYMPATVFNNIHSSTAALDYSNAQYAHAFNVNGTAYSGELFYNNAWHTWLVGGLGAGGQGFYALDVTTPTQFSETNASSLVKGDWSNTSLSCANVSNCGNALGYTFGTPQIRRFHNGQWGFVLGNGFNSSKGTAGIFVVLVDPSDGSTTVYYLDTGSGSASAKNGIAYVTPADLDGDHITDYVYGSDINGNVWRFDLTNATATNWSVSKFGRSVATPLFSTPNSQPITTKPVVAIVPAKSGNPRVIVSFGTGNKIPQTTSSAALYAGGTQSLYGVWDWDMTDWNAKAGASAQMNALAGPVTLSTSNLQVQTVSVISAATSLRTVSSTAICWQGSSDCGSNNSRYGWYLNLPTSSEQVIYSPVLYQGALIVNTTIPANNTPLNCASELDSGWTMAISIASGGSFAQSFFADSTGKFVNYTGTVVSGMQLAAVGSPSVVTAGPSGGSQFPYLVNQTSAGTGDVRRINPPGGTVGARITWQQIR
jgi:type IV pilus assembly protein PilY1